MRMGLFVLVFALLAACVSPPTASRESVGLSWENVNGGTFGDIQGRPVSLDGWVVIPARSSIYLLRNRRDAPNQNCVGLMLSDEQLRRVGRGGHVRITGEFFAQSIRTASNVVVTFFERESRRLYPLCVSAEGLAPYIFVRSIVPVG